MHNGLDNFHLQHSTATYKTTSETENDTTVIPEAAGATTKHICNCYNCLHVYVRYVYDLQTDETAGPEFGRGAR